MTVFVDTSAFLAVLDADDQHHRRAEATWNDLLAHQARMLCTNYVLIETFALVQHRLGVPAVRTLQEDVLPVLGVEWVGEELNRAGVSALLTSGRRQLSLVDCVSFETMRRLGVQTAFAFDRHFEEQGFEVIPA